MSEGAASRPERIHSNAMFSALREAGIIRDGDYVRRVIIDIAVQQAVIMYVERYGDQRLLDIARTLDGIQIRAVDREQEETVSEAHEDGVLQVPAEEHRGGEHPDWARARPGQPLPEKEPDPDEEAG